MSYICSDVGWRPWVQSLEAPRFSGESSHCFLMAGWKKCGVSKGGLVILEKLPETSE